MNKSPPFREAGEGMYNINETIVALATPPGIGAIGIIRLSGKNAIAITDVGSPGTELEFAL